jgi:hypothetical protein
MASWRQHQMAAARAVKDGDEAGYVRERTEAKLGQLAARLRKVADADPPLTFEQRARLAATLLGSGDPS